MLFSDHARPPLFTPRDRVQGPLVPTARQAIGLNGRVSGAERCRRLVRTAHVGAVARESSHPAGIARV